MILALVVIRQTQCSFVFRPEKKEEKPLYVHTVCMILLYSDVTYIENKIISQ